MAIKGRRAVPPRRRRPSPIGRFLGYVAAGAFCLFCFWLGTQTRLPFLRAEAQRADTDKLERQAMRLRLHNQHALVEVKSLDTRPGIERAARRLGWLMPGERRLTIPGH